MPKFRKKLARYLSATVSPRSRQAQYLELHGALQAPASAAAPQAEGDQAVPSAHSSDTSGRDGEPRQREGASVPLHEVAQAVSQSGNVAACDSSNHSQTVRCRVHVRSNFRCNRGSSPYKTQLRAILAVRDAQDCQQRWPWRAVLLCTKGSHPWLATGGDSGALHWQQA